MLKCTGLSVYGGHTINHYALLPSEYDNLFLVISTKY